MAIKRPTFPKVSEEMKRWSALLADEIKRWPGTRVGSMFGMISVYRGDTIFALLPDKRGLELPNAIATKLNGPGQTEAKKWQSFVIESDQELKIALERLDQAYRAAK
jgi:hypothetical protein